MILVIQTYSWIFILGLIIIPLGIFYITTILKNLWYRKIDKFFRKIQQQEGYTESLIRKLKQTPVGILEVLKWFFVLLVIFIASANIYSIQNTGNLLFSFAQLVWLLGGLFQLLVWPLAEGFLYLASCFDATKAEVQNPQALVLFYTLSFSFIIGSIFWALVPFDNWIEVVDEKEGEEPDRVRAQSRNRMVRNGVRLLGILLLFLYLFMTGKFEKTMVPMWRNEGLERVGAAFSHYGEQALLIKPDPVKKVAGDSTGIAATTGNGVAPVVYSDGTKKSSGAGVTTTAKDAKGSGGFPWFWVIVILFILVAAVGVGYWKFPQKMPKFQKQQQVDLDEVIKVLWNAEKRFDGWEGYCAVLKQALTDGKIQEIAKPQVEFLVSTIEKTWVLTPKDAYLEINKYMSKPDEISKLYISRLLAVTQIDEKYEVIKVQVRNVFKLTSVLLLFFAFGACQKPQTQMAPVPVPGYVPPLEISSTTGTSAVEAAPLPTTTTVTPSTTTATPPPAVLPTTSSTVVAVSDTAKAKEAKLVDFSAPAGNVVKNVKKVEGKKVKVAKTRKKVPVLKNPVAAPPPPAVTPPPTASGKWTIQISLYSTLDAATTAATAGQIVVPRGKGFAVCLGKFTSKEAAGEYLKKQKIRGFVREL